jgi:hypothetical protein
MSKNDKSNNDKSDNFMTLNELADKNKLVNCYQIQVENNKYKPVFLGKYPEVPLPINKVINYDNNNKLHVVTYVLTEKEVQDGLLKIVGVNLFKGNDTSSICGLDLVANNGKYELVYSDHLNNTSNTIKKLNNFPQKDKVIEYVVENCFTEPFKSILLE